MDDGSKIMTGVSGYWTVRDGTPVGFVTTAARHHELGPIALALVKRSVPDDADLIASGIPLRIDPTARPPKS